MSRPSSTPKTSETYNPKHHLLKQLSIEIRAEKEASFRADIDLNVVTREDTGTVLEGFDKQIPSDLFFYKDKKAVEVFNQALTKFEEQDLPHYYTKVRFLEDTKLKEEFYKLVGDKNIPDLYPRFRVYINKHMSFDISSDLQNVSTFQRFTDITKQLQDIAPNIHMNIRHFYIDLGHTPAEKTVFEKVNIACQQLASAPNIVSQTTVEFQLRQYKKLTPEEKAAAKLAKEEKAAEKAARAAEKAARAAEKAARAAEKAAEKAARVERDEQKARDEAQAAQEARKIRDEARKKGRSKLENEETAENPMGSPAQLVKALSYFDLGQLISETTDDPEINKQTAIVLNFLPWLRVEKIIPEVKETFKKIISPSVLPLAVA